jgi:hypothetical protein
VQELAASLAKKTAENVHRHKCPKIADVPIVIDGRAAGVHPDGIVRGGGKLLNLAGQRVVEME